MRDGPALPLPVITMQPHTQRYARARAGLEPAETLTTRERERLVGDLHALGWTDVEIAEHTRMTTYTTARIRARVARAHRARKGAA